MLHQTFLFLGQLWQLFLGVPNFRIFTLLSKSIIKALNLFQGIIERDQIVFESAIKRNIPIMMVTSGGYQRTTARIIADSIKNLKTKKLISCDEAENAPKPGALL